MDTEEACQEQNACAQSELSMTTRKKVILEIYWDNWRLSLAVVAAHFPSNDYLFQDNNAPFKVSELWKNS